MDIRPLGNSPPPTSAFVEKHVLGTEVAAAAAKPAAPVEAAVAVQPTGDIPKLAQLVQTVKSINRILQEQSQNLEFSIDSDSKRTIIKIVDQKTKEVLRQIPGEDILEISKALDLAQQGLLIKQKA